MAIKPQDYSDRSDYRPPATWYQRLSPVAVFLTRLGLTPRGVVVLEVPGRSSKTPRRTPLLTTRYEGNDHLVALAGESQWVRNVRANDGRATVIRRRSRAAWLHELPPSDRAPVIVSYLDGDDPTGRQARYYFGLDPGPTISDIEPIVDRYPVFRIQYGP